MSNSTYSHLTPSESWYNRWVNSSYYFGADNKNDLTNVDQLINNVFDIFRAENKQQEEKQYYISGEVIPKGMAGICAKIENLF